MEIARPVRIRTSIHLGDRVLIQAYDGHTAWELNALQGDTSPHVLDPGTARNVIAGADLDGPLVDYAPKGYRLELAGRDTADGRPAYAIRVLRPDSLEDTYFIDAASFLQIKWQGHRTLNGTAIVFETYFRDYRTVDGLQLPFRLDSGTLGRSGGVHFEFDTIAVDVPIADDRFAMP